jgi:hypothetical protein
MNEKHLAVLRELYKLGYAVSVFNPTELDGANPDDVMDSMNIAGLNEINRVKAEK